MFEQIKGYKSVIFFGLALLVAVAQMFGFGEFEMSADPPAWNQTARRAERITQRAECQRGNAWKK